MQIQWGGQLTDRKDLLLHPDRVLQADSRELPASSRPGARQAQEEEPREVPVHARQMWKGGEANTEPDPLGTALPAPGSQTGAPRPEAREHLHEQPYWREDRGFWPGDEDNWITGQSKRGRPGVPGEQPLHDDVRIAGTDELEVIWLAEWHLLTGHNHPAALPPDVDGDGAGKDHKRRSKGSASGGSQGTKAANRGAGSRVPASGPEAASEHPAHPGPCEQPGRHVPERFIFWIDGGWDGAEDDRNLRNKVRWWGLCGKVGEDG